MSLLSEYPIERLISGYLGRGTPLRLTPTGPTAAGADWVLRPPTGARFRIMGGTATLVTSAAVATRQAAFVLDDGSEPMFTIEASATQLAGLTQVYDLILGQTTSTLIATHLPVYFPPEVWIDYNFRFRSSTGALQAGDQWSAINLYVAEIRDVFGP